MFENCNELTFNSEEEWLKIRDKGIGGSDVGTILGYNKYKSSYTLFLEKTGRQKADDLSENEAVQRGKKAEEHLVALCNVYNPEKEFFNPNVTFQRKDKPWMLANIDGVSKDLKEGLEIKTACVRNMSEWRDSIPQTYYCQVMWYMAVTGLEKFTLYAAVESLSFEGNRNRVELVQHTILRNQEEIDFIEQEVEKFWDKVKKNEWKEFKISFSI